MMKIQKVITEFSVTNSKKIIKATILLTLVIGILATVPSIWPESFPFLNSLIVDTDPENMLPDDEPARVFHNEKKKEFSLYDIVVVGIVNEKDKNGVFNPSSLRKIYELSEYSKTLRWVDPKNINMEEGVISVDLISPSTVDNIEQGAPGEVKFEWLMSKPPETKNEALKIREKAERIPFLEGTLVSEDGKAICLYLPLTSKDMSYRVYSKLQEKIREFEGDEKFYITGLPVANDTFGVEMFKQMAVSAPIAMVVIFLLMFYFFKKITLIISPIIIAMASVICTMSVLIITGNTVHIMSSMIPIFIMPIAVLDSVHILSEFFDKYTEIGDRRKTISLVMEELFTPMLYTSLTSTVGFVSLALAPIPPVQIFGIFIGLGIMLAWFLTIIFIPAYVMLLPESSLENFGIKGGDEKKKTGISKILSLLEILTYKKGKLILTFSFIILLVSGYGIFKIQINDNPVKWFAESHRIRIADKELNKHFGGTYMAYLYLEGAEGDEVTQSYFNEFENRSEVYESQHNSIAKIRSVFTDIRSELKSFRHLKNKQEFVSGITDYVDKKLEIADDNTYPAWDEALNFIENEKKSLETFKQPEVLNYILELQNHLLGTGVVGKSNSLSDIVRTVYRELYSGKEEYNKIPKTPQAVAQTLLTYQNSHRPQDLWHFVTPDYMKTNLWVQLKSGNNKDMLKVVNTVSEYIKGNPPPRKLTHKWFGLTYINVVWQQKMVSGMLNAFLGSFLVVFLMMTILFRSALWGILSMIPLTVTISFIYGIVGIVGKDYDMPIAILSSLTLGLAVDFSIHFLARSREVNLKLHSWKKAICVMFDEPARAIIRNIVVIAVGFLPLLAASLMPYKTVGIFLATILTVAGITTLLILPSIMKLLENKLFPGNDVKNFKVRYVSPIVAAITTVIMVLVNINSYFNLEWFVMIIIGAPSVPLLFLFFKKFLISKEKTG